MKPYTEFFESARLKFKGQHFVFVLGQLEKFGGAERQALILAKFLRESVQARVSFLSWNRADGLMGSHLSSEGFEVFRFPVGWSHRTRGAKALRLAKLARYIRKEVRPDYLLPYVSEACKITGLVWRFTGAKYCWWNQRDEGRDLYGSRLEHRLIKSMPDIVSNSWQGRDFLISTFGLSPTRIRVLNNAVITPQRSDGSEWRNRLGLKPEDRLALMVANLTMYKDHATLLRSFAEVIGKPSGHSFHLALAGRFGETTLAIKALAFDLGLSRHLHLLGEVKDVDALYDAADLVVHSSIKEGCPNAVLEGMAHSKCVVGTDISGLHQALGANARAPFLSAAGDVAGLANSIRITLTDDSIREAAGRANADRIATEFTIEGLAQNVLEGIQRFAAR